MVEVGKAAEMGVLRSCLAPSPPGQDPCAHAALRCAALRSVAVRYRYRYRYLPATCYYYAIIARRASLASRAMRLVQLRKRRIRKLVLLPVACPALLRLTRLSSSSLLTIEHCSAVSPTRQEQRSFLRLTLPTTPQKHPIFFLRRPFVHSLALRPWRSR